MDKDQIDNLQEIRTLMERSSRFLSLSGLSGISAGIIALIGAAIAFFYLDFDERYFDVNSYFSKRSCQFQSKMNFIILDAILILILALSAGYFFTSRKAKKQGLKIWNNTAKRLLVNLFIPLITGGLFCIVLLYHGMFFLVAPATLIFYGLALINASKYTLPDIRYLGISEIILGLAGSVMVGYGLVIWTIGFGVLHIIYGTVMYRKYERG
jgi:hypothetical protein